MNNSESSGQQVEEVSAGTWRFHVALAVIVLVALSVRLLQINESLWVDELHTSWAVADGWSDVAPRAYIGNQHPLYFWLVRAVVGIAGQSELSLRAISLFAGIGFVAVAGIAAQRYTNSSMAGLLAAWLVATDHEFIYFSQEARTYALVQLLGLIQFCCGYRMLYEAKLRWRIPFVVLSIGLFYLHYTTGLLLVGECVAAIVLYRTSKQRPHYSYRNLFNDFVLIGSICLLTTHHHLREIFDRRLNWKSFVSANPRSDLIRYFDVYFLTAAIALLSATIWRYISKRPTWMVLDAKMCCLALVAILPVGMSWSATYLEVVPVFFYRYLIVLLFVGPLVAALICARLPRPWGMVFCCGLILFAGYAHGRSTNWWSRGIAAPVRWEDWRAAAELIDREGRDWPVLLQAGFIETNKLTEEHEDIWSEFLSCPLRGIYRIDRADERLVAGTRNSMVLIERNQARLRDRGGGWLVIRTNRPDVARKLAHSLVKWAAFDIEVNSHHGVHVLKLIPSAEGRGRVLEPR